MQTNRGHEASLSDNFRKREKCTRIVKKKREGLENRILDLTSYYESILGVKGVNLGIQSQSAPDNDRAERHLKQSKTKLTSAMSWNICSVMLQTD